MKFWKRDVVENILPLMVGVAGVAVAFGSGFFLRLWLKAQLRAQRIRLPLAMVCRPKASTPAPGGPAFQIQSRHHAGVLERKHQPVLSRRKFALRMARSITASAALILGSLALGTVGYHVVSGLDWIDAEYNAVMILTGMGPAEPMTTTAGKLFASGYALFSAVAFLTGVAVLLTPVAHRILHRFHVADDGQ